MANPHHIPLKKSFLLPLILACCIIITIGSAYFLLLNHLKLGIEPRFLAYTTLLGLLATWQLCHMVNHAARKIYSVLIISLGLVMVIQSYRHQQTYYLLGPLPSSFVYYYYDYQLNPLNGKLKLLQTIGANPPSNQSAYVNCAFNLKDISDFFRPSPQMCVAYDAWGRITMHYDHHLLQGMELTETYFTRYDMQASTLLGETYQQQKKHFAYVSKGNSFHLKEVNIYSIAEHAVQSPKVLESFTYDGTGKLLHFTLSSMLNSDENGVFAQYNQFGDLIARPKLTRSFMFPSKIETKRFAQLD